MSELVAVLEGSLANMRELSRALAEREIETELAAPPKRACCGGNCGCGQKLQLMVRPEDAPKVTEFMQSEWLSAVAREGVTAGLVQLGTPAQDDGVLRCPACNFAGELVNGACSDCGLQLE